MKVEFLRNHNGRKAGENADVPDNLANYLIRTKAAKAVGKTEKAKVAPAKKAEAPAEPVKEKRAVRDMDMANVVEKVKDAKPGGKKKDAGPLEPTVNSKPDKHEVSPHEFETSEK